MTYSSIEMTLQEKVIKERVTQSKKFSSSNAFNQSLRDFWNEVKEDSNYGLLKRLFT